MGFSLPSNTPRPAALGPRHSLVVAILTAVLLALLSPSQASTSASTQSQHPVRGPCSDACTRPCTVTCNSQVVVGVLRLDWKPSTTWSVLSRPTRKRAAYAGCRLLMLPALSQGVSLREGVRLLHEERQEELAEQHVHRKRTPASAHTRTIKDHPYSTTGHPHHQRVHLCHLAAREKRGIVGALQLGCKLACPHNLTASKSGVAKSLCLQQWCLKACTESAKPLQTEHALTPPWRLCV